MYGPLHVANCLAIDRFGYAFGGFVLNIFIASQFACPLSSRQLPSRVSPSLTIGIKHYFTKFRFELGFGTNFKPEHAVRGDQRLVTIFAWSAFWPCVSVCGVPPVIANPSGPRNGGIFLPAAVAGVMERRCAGAIGSGNSKTIDFRKLDSRAGACHLAVTSAAPD
jgi:hypothetical protein